MQLEDETDLKLQLQNENEEQRTKIKKLKENLAKKTVEDKEQMESEKFSKLNEQIDERNNLVRIHFLLLVQISKTFS